MRAVLNRILGIANASYANNARDIYYAAVSIISDVQDIYNGDHQPSGIDGPWRWDHCETEEIAELAYEDKYITTISAFYESAVHRTITLDIENPKNKLRPTITINVHAPESEYVYVLNVTPDTRTTSWTYGRAEHLLLNDHDPYFLVTFRRQLLVQPPCRPLVCAEEDPSIVMWRVDGGTLECRAVLETWMHNYNKHRIGGPAFVTNIGNYERGMHQHSALYYINGEYMTTKRMYIDNVIRLEKSCNLTLLSTAEKAAIIIGG